MSVDGRGKAIDEIVDDRVSISHPYKLIFLIVIEVDSALLGFEPVFLQNPERNQINVGIED